MLKYSLFIMPKMQTAGKKKNIKKYFGNTIDKINKVDKYNTILKKHNIIKILFDRYKL